MSGEVALPEGAETRWNSDSLASARRLNSDLLTSDEWLACVLPVGDGIGVAAQRWLQPTTGIVRSSESLSSARCMVPVTSS